MNKNKTDKIIVSLTKWFGIALFVGIIIWGATYFLKGYRYEQTNDAQVDAYLSPINTKSVAISAKYITRTISLLKKAIRLW